MLQSGCLLISDYDDKSKYNVSLNRNYTMVYIKNNISHQVFHSPPTQYINCIIDFA